MKIPKKISTELRPLKPPLGAHSAPQNPQLYLLNPKKLNLYDKTVVISILTQLNICTLACLYINEILSSRFPMKIICFAI